MTGRRAILEAFTHERSYTIEIAYPIEILGLGAPAIGHAA
jgi:hypothetical protein